MKFSILLTLALSYTTLSSAQNFRRDNADKAEQLTREFAKLTKDSPCENNAQACVENQFAQCVNGKFQLNSCGGGELKCVVLPLVNKAGTSITCSTEADRLARLADARGEPPPNQGKSKNGILPPDSEQDNGKNGKLPPNEGDGKDENTPPELGKGKNGKSPPDNLCKCPGNDNGKDGNDNGKDDNDNGKDGNDNGKDGNDNGKDGNDNDTENGDGNDDGKDNGDGNENDGIDNGDGNGKDENDNGKDENDNGKDENDNGKDENDNGKDENDNGKDENDNAKDGNDNAKDGNVPDNQDTPKNPDNVQTPPANGDGNLADIRRQNAAEARALQEKFDQLKPDDECNDNEVACVENKFAQCSGGKFALTDCASGTICAALPLVLKKGTTVACTTEADRDARLKQSETNTK